MSSRMESNYHRQREDETDVEEFARQFFGTHEKYQDNPPRENYGPHPRKHHKRHENNTRHSEQDRNLDKPSKTSSRSKLKHRSLNEEGGTPGSVGHISSRNSKQFILRKFLKLLHESVTLSERLDKVNMPEMSKRLTQVLAERQRLMMMLLGMEAKKDGALSNSSESTPVKGNEIHHQSKNSKDKEFVMPERTKSVHWSDEHLGGSIIQDPETDSIKASIVQDPEMDSMKSSLAQDPEIYSMEFTYPRPTSRTPVYSPKKMGHYSGYNGNVRETESFPQSQPKSKKKEYGQDKPPPKYKVNTLPLTHQRRTSLPLDHCDISCEGIGHALAYVQDMINEVTVLRREASSMLWRAHYLEQLCDLGGDVKHRYYLTSPSGMSALPRYLNEHL